MQGCKVYMLLTISPKRIKSYETELERNFEHKEDEMKHEQIKSVTHTKILKKIIASYKRLCIKLYRSYVSETFCQL